VIPARETAAIILAAGFSQRMGRFKPLLPLGCRPMIEWDLDLFAGCGLAEIHVVVGHRLEELMPLLAARGVDVVVNRDFEQGMFSSVKAGIRSLSPDCRAFFVLPADIPLVRPATIGRLLESLDPPRARISVPCFAGRKGHPPLIARDLAPAILAAPEEGGLRTALSRWEDQTLSVAVPDRHILNDADHRDDYENLQAACRRREIPDAEECREILAALGPEEAPIARHGREVARVAGILTAALKQAGIDLDADLIQAAARVHDLAKGASDHACIGAERLRAMGFGAVADIVACHHDIPIEPQGPISAAEVVYLADKRVAGDQAVALDKRFAAALARYGEVEEARRDIQHRRDQVLAVQARIGGVIGQSVDGLLEKEEERQAEKTNDDR
jgi:molybdenum cofactor cytidylyltransferase